jgi:tRNA U38,U39,U40 pseudouridine synthase TruA
MIGCLIFIFLNKYSHTYITNTFFRNQIVMPVAPALGLYLHSPSFDNYNKKKDIPEQLIFSSLESVKALQESTNAHIVSQDESVWS